MRENNRWGLDDKELFDIVINDRKSTTNEKPFVDIIMTLSTHEPFIILENQEKYEQKARQILANCDSVSSKEKNNIIKNIILSRIIRFTIPPEPITTFSYK